MNAEIDLKFAPLHAERAGRVNSIRLARERGNASLATLSDANDGAPPVDVSSLDGQELTRRLFNFELQSPYGAPSWDVAASQSGLAAIWTKPGSAICPLAFRAPGGTAGVLTGRYPSGVFQNPRFVRARPASPPAATAVLSGNSSTVLVLFASPLPNGDSSYVPLPPAGSGILQDGLLVSTSTGFLLLSKYLATGLRKAERMDARGESFQPGLLRSLELTAELKPVGLPTSPIGDTLIYEFDADLWDGRASLFTTTEKGYVVAIAGRVEGKFVWDPAPEVAVHPGLTTPSVLGTDKAIYIAALQGDASRFQIVLGHF